MWGRGSDFWCMIREGLSGVTCKPRGLSGKLRPRLKGQEMSSPGGSILGTGKGSERREVGDEVVEAALGPGAMSFWHSGDIHAILSEMGTRWGLRFQQGKDML